jgi:uncharacterized secreted protein with C-terminal beta-propeller domain
MTRTRTLSLTAPLVALALAACDPGVAQTPPAEDERPAASGIELARFSGCEDLRSYVTDAWVETLVQSRYGYGYGLDSGAEDSAGSGDGGGGDSPSDWSETNVQEEGVDEPDMVKTDGDFIYLAQQGELTIVDSWPAEETHKVASLELDVDPFTMFLHEDRVVLFSYDWENAPFETGYGYSYGTKVHVIDVSDRADPQVLREMTFEGYYTNARMVGSDVYMVMNTWAWMPDELWELAWSDDAGLPDVDWNDPEFEQAAARTEARMILTPLVAARIAEIPEDELTMRFVDDGAGAAPTPEALLDCRDVYHPAEVSTPNLLSVVHFDVADGESGGAPSGTGAMANGWTVYASQDNLYVSQTSWWWWWGWGDLDVNTRIHRFKLDGGETVYEASGEVDGWLLNQFSMSEYDGHLRAATTDITWWWGEDEPEEDPANHVYVLDADTMGEVGHIGGIAPNEQVQSARFMGEKGYVVTYERIDPLFTIDLSEPADPQVVGELKIPGFSTYLHPYGDDHLLAVGWAGTDEGEITGFAVNLFDVSDFADPQLQQSIELDSDDWSWSQSLWDHHAFTLHRGVLNLPVYTWDYDESTGRYDGFSGMWVIDATDVDSGIAELGKVDHEDLVAASDCLYGSSYECEEYYWYAWMKRSVVVEDKLFSISDYGIKVTQLDDPTDEVASVLFWPR